MFKAFCYALILTSALAACSRTGSLADQKTDSTEAAPAASEVGQRREARPGAEYNR